MRWMNSSAPSAKPTTMPSVRSRKTVEQEGRAAAPPRRPRTSAAARRRRASRPCSRRRWRGRRPARPAGCKLASGAATSMKSEQEDRMQHARHRAARAGADIGGGARDGAGDADAAEQGGADVGDALRHQLAVGAVPPAGHAVGDHRREQRFDRAQQGEGQRGRQHRLHLREREGGQLRHRQAARNAAEARADGLDRQAQHTGERRRRAITAISMPGQCGRSCRRTRMTAMVSSATPKAAALKRRQRPPAATSILAISSPGSAPSSVSPSSS